MSRRTKGSALASALVGLVVMAACSSSSSDSASCAADPLSCPAGETCWPVDTSLTLSCIQSDPGRPFGSTCQETIDFAGCSDGLTCDAPSANADGTCTSYCDAKAPCPVGYSCQSVQFNGGRVSVSICRAGAGPTGDAGASPEDAAPTSG